MTVSELLEKVQSFKTQEEAQSFLIKELQVNQFAWSNIKYVTGYLGNEERNRILKLFNAG